MARAAQLLLFKHHMHPGAKRWELRRVLGRNYEQVLRALDQELERLGLKIKQVGEGDSDSDLFVVTFKEHPPLGEFRTFGWRIDDMAMLTAALAHLTVKGGKAPAKEVMQLLEEKFPKWRVQAAIDRFIRMGYLSEDDRGVLYIGWRTRAEIDQQTLIGLLLGKSSEKNRNMVLRRDGEKDSRGR
jgi:hypothetical protein